MRKTSLLVIFLTVFIDLIGFGIVLPLLPLYGEHFGASGFFIGVIIASYSMMQFLFAPAWGRLSDRIGRRPVLLVSLAGSTASYVLFAIASGLEGKAALTMLLVSRVFAGICGANLSVASAYIADVSPPDKRSARMALIGVAFGLGFIFGPVLGGLSFKAFSFPGPGWVAAGFCCFNFLMAIVVLGESKKKTSTPSARLPKLEQFANTLRQPNIGLLIGVFFLATFCFTCFESTFIRLMNDFGHLEEHYAMYFFAYCGVIAIIVQGGLMGRLVKRFGEQRLIYASLFILAVSLGLLPFFMGVAGMLLTLGLFATGSGMNRPPTFGLISLLTPAGEQGSTLGVAQSAGSLARILGPIFANTVYDYIPALPYLFCAGIAFCAGLVAYHYLDRNRPLPQGSGNAPSSKISPHNKAAMRFKEE